MIEDVNLRVALEKAKAGRASDMTPEEMECFKRWSMNKSEIHTEGIQTRQEEARRGFTQMERDIFSYVRREYNRIAANGEYDPDRDDPIVLAKAAERFHVAPEEVKQTYLKVDGAGLKLE